jgi:hypothetical protein
MRVVGKCGAVLVYVNTQESAMMKNKWNHLGNKSYEDKRHLMAHSLTNIWDFTTRCHIIALKMMYISSFGLLLTISHYLFDIIALAKGLLGVLTCKLIRIMSRTILYGNRRSTRPCKYYFWNSPPDIYEIHDYDAMHYGCDIVKS